MPATASRLKMPYWTGRAVRKRGRSVNITLGGLHLGQEKVLRSKARFKVVTAGRRWGKTKLGTAMSLMTALEGGRAWWVAPTYKLTEPAWREQRAYARMIPGCTIREADHRIEMGSGGWLEVRSADNPDSLRGDGLDLAVLDEAAYMPERAWTEAISKALLDRKGKALFISTPAGRNWFWQLWVKAQQDTAGEWAAWHFTTQENPFIDPAEVERERLTTPEQKFRQEVLAEFIEDSGLVFRRIHEAVASCAQNERIEGHQYVIGADWAKHLDFTVFAVVDVTEKALVYLDRFNQIDYAVQVGRLKALYDRFKPEQVIAESNSMGEPVIEQLQRENLPVQPFITSNATKAGAIEGLALAFERGDMKIIGDQVLMDELLGYSMDRLPSGMIRYGAPVGMHDDCVMALALAWHGAATPLLMKFWALE